MRITEKKSSNGNYKRVYNGSLKSYQKSFKLMAALDIKSDFFVRKMEKGPKSSAKIYELTL